MSRVTSEISLDATRRLALPYKCMTPLSPSQLKVYQYLKEQFYATGSMPTLREIASAMKWKAVGSAQDAIRALIEKGFLERDPQKARGLQLKDSLSLRSVPILGSAPAGQPVEAVENHMGDVAIPDFLRGPVFAVRVTGDSMLEAGIEDGDIVIVRQSAEANHNEVVVADLDGEVTIKRLIRKGRALYLKPENSKYKPIKVEDPSFRILGKVIGLHRYWESI